MPKDPNLDQPTAISCYLSTIGAIADCVGLACPEIGGLYRHRLNRLRTRLAFDTSPEALEESCKAADAALDEYARKASAFVAGQREELHAASLAFRELVDSLDHRQHFYNARLRQILSEFETGKEHAALSNLIESMTDDIQSLIAKMNGALETMQIRVNDMEITDPVTGLMNRREMERQIELHAAAGETPVLLHFQLTGQIASEVAREIAARLGSHLRHQDLVSRWAMDEFLVLFQGPAEVAQMRAEQIVPWVAGRYLLDNGETVQVAVEARLMLPELVS